MRVGVVDTSALVRLYISDGPVPDLLESFIDAAYSGDAIIIVPELALVEATQVLRKKEINKVLGGAEVDEIFQEILSLPLTIKSHKPLLPKSLELAREFSVTIYDAVFLALAVEYRSLLITADEKLMKVRDKVLN